MEIPLPDQINTDNPGQDYLYRQVKITKDQRGQAQDMRYADNAHQAVGISRCQFEDSAVFFHTTFLVVDEWLGLCGVSCASILEQGIKIIAGQERQFIRVNSPDCGNRLGDPGNVLRFIRFSTIGHGCQIRGIGLD